MQKNNLSQIYLKNSSASLSYVYWFFVSQTPSQPLGGDLKVQPMVCKMHKSSLLGTTQWSSGHQWASFGFQGYRHGDFLGQLLYRDIRVPTNCDIHFIQYLFICSVFWWTQDSVTGPFWIHHLSIAMYSSVRVLEIAPLDFDPSISPQSTSIGSRSCDVIEEILTRISPLQTKWDTEWDTELVLPFEPCRSVVVPVDPHIGPLGCTRALQHFSKWINVIQYLSISNVQSLV